MSLTVDQYNNGVLITQAARLSEHQLDVSPEWFEPDFWRHQGKVEGKASGRGTTFFIREKNQQLVLRHYCRGGLIRHLSKDKFLFQPLRKTRPYQELELLSAMAEMDLPVPAPLAGRVLFSGIFYRADLLTFRIPNAKDAHHCLLEHELSQDTWQRIGQTIRQFHDKQVFHHDLNIHNIMLDDKDKVWLIDFDKCKFRNGNQWKSQNLERLQRSLVKERGKESQYGFKTENWQWLLKGYSER